MESTPSNNTQEPASKATAPPPDRTNHKPKPPQIPTKPGRIPPVQPRPAMHPPVFCTFRSTGPHCLPIEDRKGTVLEGRWNLPRSVRDASQRHDNLNDASEWDEDTPLHSCDRSILGGCGIIPSAQNAAHEIERLILLLIGAILISGAAILEGPKLLSMRLDKIVALEKHAPEGLSGLWAVSMISPVP